MPGGLIYLLNKVFIEMGIKPEMLVKSFYNVPDYYHSDDKAFIKALKEMDRQKKELEGTGMKFYPGYAETALKVPGFLKEISNKGFKEFWIYMRRDHKVHRLNKFCLPEFYDLEPYNF